MNEIVSAMHDVSDDVLNALSLKPWLSVQVELVSVRSHEGIVHAHLVEHDPHVFGWNSIEARQVSATERISSISDLEKHIHRAFDFRV